MGVVFSRQQDLDDILCHPIFRDAIGYISLKNKLHSSYAINLKKLFAPKIDDKNPYFQ
jgi:hypothetical protein